MSDRVKTYEYIRYMRNGSVKKVTAVVRARSKGEQPASERKK